MNGFPFEESIRSLLPLVDEYVIAVGSSADETYARVKDIQNPKIRVIATEWNESMLDRGFVYGQQKMIAHFNCTGDWAFYLEADEVLHENDIDRIRDRVHSVHDDNRVEALYFDFLHFYGTPNQTGIAGYRKAPRIIRNSLRVISPDGLFFIVMDKNKSGRYPRAKYAGASIYHYGHCRKVEYVRSKLSQIGKYWNTKHAHFHSYGNIDLAELREFVGTHPAVMKDWISNSAEHVFVQSGSYILTFKNLRNRVRFFIERVLGLEISKKHFQQLD